MKVKELVRKLSEYDGEQKVMFLMLRHKSKDEELPVHEIHEVDQLSVHPGDSEDESFKAVCLMSLERKPNTGM